jgi:energy-coupling factor transporter ATP-binding protein EcfA2
VSFQVPPGQVAAFLGPNGAGESTVLKILTGYLQATKGVGRIAGLDDHPLVPVTGRADSDSVNCRVVENSLVPPLAPGPGIRPLDRPLDPAFLLVADAGNLSAFDPLDGLEQLVLAGSGRNHPDCNSVAGGHRLVFR